MGLEIRILTRKNYAKFYLKYNYTNKRKFYNSKNEKSNLKHF